jgi:ribonuclease HI
MDPDPHALQILVDGSCLIHDGRKSGYAGYIHHPDGTMDEVILCGYRESTINRMELSACIAALDWIREERPKVGRVQVFSDSRYVIDNIPRARYWRDNGWRNLDGRPIEHRDLWKKFISAWSKSGRIVHFGWAKGKADAARKIVDLGAKAAAKAGARIDPGYIAGKIGRAKTKGGSATMFPAAGQDLAIRIYGSRLERFQ